MGEMTFSPARMFACLGHGIRDLLFPPLCWACGRVLHPASASTDVWANLFCPACCLTVVMPPEPTCPLCGQPRVSEAHLCKRCGGTIRGFHRATAGALYHGTVRDLVLRMKFGGQVRAAYPLALLTREGVTRIWKDHPAECVIAVPLHPARRRARGYNQAEWIARFLAEVIDVPFLKGVVKRVRNTLPQGTGGGGSRRENVHQAFEPIKENLGTWMRGDLPGCAVQGRRVLLVDDVISTGATMDQCGTALMEAGAESVAAAAAAT